MNVSTLCSLVMGIGWEEVQPAFARVHQHQTWSIPWLEDDSGMIGAELWVNRTLERAYTAKSYGVSGLLGIHWRTVETALTTTALARAAWDARHLGDEMPAPSPAASTDSIYRDYARSAFGQLSQTVRLLS